MHEYRIRTYQINGSILKMNTENTDMFEISETRFPKKPYLIV